VTFIVNASKDERTTTTVRLRVPTAIAKADAFLDAGWQVFITGPDGTRYHPLEFEKLLQLDSKLQSPS
jgi:uncharacterized protein YcnI